MSALPESVLLEALQMSDSAAGDTRTANALFAKLRDDEMTLLDLCEAHLSRVRDAIAAGVPLAPEFRGVGDAVLTGLVQAETCAAVLGARATAQLFRAKHFELITAHCGAVEVTS